MQRNTNWFEKMEVITRRAHSQNPLIKSFDNGTDKEGNKMTNELLTSKILICSNN